MTVGIWVLGDQLWCEQAALASDGSAPVLLIESHRHAAERRYHRQKDRKSTRLNSSHPSRSRMPSSA